MIIPGVSQLISNLPCIVFRCVHGVSVATLYVSDGVEGIAKFAAGEFVGPKGRSLMSLAHPEDSVRLASVVAAALAAAREFGAGEYEYEYRIYDARGEMRWVLEQGKVTRAEEGSWHQDGVILDITAQKRAAEIVAEHQARLVTSSRLYSLSEMASGVAHEINNPLAIIKGRVSQIKSIIGCSPLNIAEAEKHLENIDQVTGRIAKIVQSLRTLARDTESDDFESTDLRILLSDALELCYQKMESKGVRVSLTGLESRTPIRCRPAQLSQVLLHLLYNAHDAVENLDERSVSVHVEDGEDFVDISITDSGNGIPKKIQEKIFQPFYTTKTVGKGTGLGLSVSRNFIKAHGGQLRLDTSCANTRFVITIPKDPSMVLKAAG